MKLIMFNGIVLIALAVFLYYQTRYRNIDRIFLSAQLAELALGLINMILIGRNIASGQKPSGRIKQVSKS